MAKETGRLPKLFLIIALLGAIVGAGIVVAVKLPQNIAAKREMEERQEEMRLEEMELELTDLKIPQEFAEIWKSAWYPYRPQMKQWTKEQARRFDVDSDNIGSTVLELENRKLIEELLEDVP